MKVNQLYNEDCLEALKKIEAKSVDIILTDPPYLYLKNQKLDRPFDENIFFNEVNRVLKDNGFIVMFGRGTSFYRWNYMLSELGFQFKEEIIWNKNYGTSPLMAITRVHETISIHCKGNSPINKVRIPYEEMRCGSLMEIQRDIKRIKTVLSNKSSFMNLEKYLHNGELSYIGKYEKSTTIANNPKQTDRVVSVAKMILEGMNEKSIITLIRDHYTAIHPTQKPVRLLERLLSLVIPKNIDKPLVLDPFAGSGSSLIAASNLGCRFIGFEIDKEYYEAAKNRISNECFKSF